MRVLTLLAAVAVAGCSSSITQIVLPDQRAGFVAECERLPDCYNRAQKACPAGYEIVQSGTRSEGALVPTAIGPMGAMTEYQTMVIVCGAVPIPAE